MIIIFGPVASQPNWPASGWTSRLLFRQTWQRATSSIWPDQQARSRSRQCRQQQARSSLVAIVCEPSSWHHKPIGWHNSYRTKRKCRLALGMRPARLVVTGRRALRLKGQMGNANEPRPSATFVPNCRSGSAFIYASATLEPKAQATGVAQTFRFSLAGHNWLARPLLMQVAHHGANDNDDRKRA